MKSGLVIIALIGVSATNDAWSLSSEIDRHNFYPNFLACMLIEDGTADVASEFNLSPDALRIGIDTYSTEQTFSSAEIESFQWCAAMPTSCSQYVGAGPRYTHYVVEEALTMFNQSAGLSLVWTDSSTRATGQACGDFLSLATPSLEDEAFVVLEAMVQGIERHPVLGKQSSLRVLEDLKARWRAYWIGRSVGRVMGKPAAEFNEFVFEPLPEAVHRHEFDFHALALPLFYTSPDFTDEQIAAFGPLGVDASAGMSLNRYIGVQQVWNYLFSGNPMFPVRPADDARALALKDDLITHLLGEAPGPGDCSPVAQENCLRDYNSIQRQVSRFVRNQLRERLGSILEAAREPETLHQETGESVGSVVKPALAEWRGADCVVPIVRATYQTSPTTRSSWSDTEQISYKYLDGDSLELEQGLNSVVLPNGLRRQLFDIDWQLNTEQAERIRRHDVVSVTARTELERLEPLEVRWCDETFDLPMFPGTLNVALPNLVTREIEQLWARN